ncbi:hypothetical protein ACK8HJ_05105 [Vreelandella titanicae]
MPCERTRSVIQAREFLIELSRNTDLRIGKPSINTGRGAAKAIKKGAA